MENKVVFEDDGMCFACGKRNPIGLKMEFKTDENGMLVGKFVPRKEFQGFKNILHGGIIATLMDEAMVSLLLKLEKKVVTTSFSMRLHKPALIGEELTVAARLVKDRGRLFEMSAEIRRSDGTVVASGEGVCVRIGK
jgi:uncharacterized protein (TIGR00369 family)